MNRGIVLLAIGDPAYGKFAANMAISIKSENAGLPIQIIYEEKAISHLSEWHKSFIDIYTPIDSADCRESGKLVPALAKLSIYKYLAFEENIYLDVDGLCINNLESIFDQCKDGYYFSQVVGRYLVEKELKEFPEMQWAKPEIMVKHFDLKEGDVIPALNSSFQFIRKGDKAELLFKTALDCLKNAIPNKDRWYKWGKDNMQPDELYLNIALAKVGLMPELPNKIIYFANKRMDKIELIKQDYKVIGLYGGIHFTHSSLQDYYDRVMEKICRGTFQKDHVFKCHQLMKGKIS